MKLSGLLLAICVSGSSMALADTVTKKIKETTSTSTQNINVKVNMADEVKKDVKYFCSTTEAVPKVQCDKWLEDQKKSLRDRLLTSSCSEPKFLYGKEEQGCMAYLSQGEVSFTISK